MRPRLKWEAVRTVFYVAADFLEQNGHQLQAAEGVEHAELMELLGQDDGSRGQPCVRSAPIRD